RLAGQVLAIHEDLDVADDGDSEELLLLALLAGRHRAARRGAGADVVDHARDVGVAAEAVGRVQRLQPARGAELRHPGVVHHRQVVGRRVGLEGRDQLLEELVVGELDDLDLHALLLLVHRGDRLERLILVALHRRDRDLAAARGLARSGGRGRGRRRRGGGRGGGGRRGRCGRRGGRGGRRGAGRRGGGRTGRGGGGLR